MSDVFLKRFRARKEGEKHRKEGLLHTFYGLLEENFETISVFSKGWHLGER